MTYDTLPTEDTLTRTVAALKERGVEAIVVGSRAEALAKLQELVPAGVSVANGSSRTLEEIGYIDYLKQGTHGWNNLHEAILAEQDPEVKAALRKQSVISDYYMGSVHAIAETGEMVIASASGSQIPHLAFTSQHLVLVAGAQKIVPTLDDAMARLKDYVFPLEDARMKSTGAAGSLIAKVLIMAHEPSFMGRTVQLILVNEKLGF
jgi:L-lactate utilization protein LutB